VADRLTLRAVVRTPTEVLFDGDVRSVRLPTPSGQVGVRARAEAWLTALSPGLVLLERAEGRLHAGTAGGIARNDGQTITLFSPFAAVGDAEAVLRALAAAQSDDEGELAALRNLSELEQRITSEVRAGRTGRSTP
jgi:F0F1-type ATP synthase epsilon subunit